MSVDSLLSDTNLLSERQQILKDIRKDEEDVFIHYYSIDQAIEDMTSPDAKKIVAKFEDSPWTSKSKWTKKSRLILYLLDLLQVSSDGSDSQDEYINMFY